MGVVSPRGTHADIGVRTCNDREAECARALEAQGYKVIKRGWPDFLAVRGDEIRLIEVKPPRGRLKPIQQEVADVLAKAGLNVETWNSET